MRALYLLLLVGCGGVVRYTHEASAPADTLAQVTERAQQARWQRDKPSTPPASTTDQVVRFHDEQGWGINTLFVYVESHATQTLLRVDADSPAMRDLVLPDADDRFAHIREALVNTSPTETLAQVEMRLEQAGWERSKIGVEHAVRVATFHDDNGKGKVSFELRAIPDGAGTLLELSATTRSILDEISPSGETYVTTDQSFSTDRFHFDTTFDVGVARSIHTDIPARVDWMVRVGHTVWTRGGDAPVLQPRRRVSIVGGVGLAITNEPAFRPELGVMIDTQDALTPFDRRLYASHRKALSFELAAPYGHDYNSLETGMTLHVPPYGGVFARAGYEWSGSKHGATYMVGARLDTIPAAFVVVTLACVALAESLKNHELSLSDFVALPE